MNQQHHPVIKDLCTILCNKTQNTETSFFKAEIAYFLGKMAACMRVKVSTEDRGDIPVNIYALGLAVSGAGKGFSINIMEDQLLGKFKQEFMENTFPTVAMGSINDIAETRSIKNSSNQQDELELLLKDYKNTGAYPFTFDSGTAPAVKQLRNKLLMAGCGSINLQIDEIASNLLNVVDVLNLFLELYDQGKAKQKITKNTIESVRTEELDGSTPANMLLFGTQSKLLDGGQIEDMFFSFLDTGYARRCIFGLMGADKKAYATLTPEETYDRLICKENDELVNKWSDHFYTLAALTNYGKKISLPRETAIELIKYKCECELLAESLPEHAEIKKAEISHRYFKALKLAGAYAFIDGTEVITSTQLAQAILLVEESGAAFQGILNRDKPYVKLAKFLAGEKTEVTHADLTEALPFYKTGNVFRSELMSLAIAWGYKNNVIIKKSFTDGIEFFTGEKLEATSLEHVKLSYSNHMASDYEPTVAPFSALHTLTQSANLHWCNHAFRGNHRSESNVITGFNLLVLDCDGGTSLNTCHELLKDYVFMTHETKRSTPELNRYRLVIPINYALNLHSNEYKEVLTAVMDYLPIQGLDSASRERSHKWETCATGNHYYNLEGKVFDILPFIPATSKNIEHKNVLAKYASMDSLDRWFIQQGVEGNRSNNMIKYALVLFDTGIDYDTAKEKIKQLNSKTASPLTQQELDTTVLATLFKKYKDTI
jgi:hypothetical protein